MEIDDITAALSLMGWQPCEFRYRSYATTSTAAARWYVGIMSDRQYAVIFGSYGSYDVTIRARDERSMMFRPSAWWRIPDRSLRQFAGSLNVGAVEWGE